MAWKVKFKCNIEDNTIKISKYLFDISQYILLPLYSFVRLFVYSFDVIHTLGITSILEQYILCQDYWFVHFWVIIEDNMNNIVAIILK